MMYVRTVRGRKPMAPVRIRTMDVFSVLLVTIVNLISQSVKYIYPTVPSK